MQRSHSKSKGYEAPLSLPTGGNASFRSVLSPERLRGSTACTFGIRVAAEFSRISSVHSPRLSAPARVTPLVERPVLGPPLSCEHLPICSCYVVYHILPPLASTICLCRELFLCSPSISALTQPAFYYIILPIRTKRPSLRRKKCACFWAEERSRTW